MVDEDIDTVLDNEDALIETVEALDTEILEVEEIKLCNLNKKYFDIEHGSRQRLLYSRDIPVK